MGSNKEFEWVAFYKELAQKLRGYSDKHSELVKVLKKTYENANIPMPTIEDDNDQIDDMDPFTFFGVINHNKRKDDRKKLLLEEVQKLLDINAEVPTSFDGVPTAMGKQCTYYHFKSNEHRQESDIDDLWNLFESALNYSSDRDDKKKDELQDYFDRVMVKHSMGTSRLTDALFWIDPDFYLNLDTPNLEFIYKSGKVPKSTVEELPYHESFLKDKSPAITKIKFEDYFNIMEKVRAFIQDSKDYDSLSDFSYQAWKWNEDKNAKDKKSKDKKANNDTAKTSSDDKIMSTVPSNSSSGKELGRNVILYGPPGTGKTYKTVVYAVAICNDKLTRDNIKELDETPYEELIEEYRKLKKEGRIAFTTFHQSYGYEEFIEGIKPDVDANDLKYKKEGGVFKDFCDNARETDAPCVFIIDEINRGNISKIFGELITLIEETKREGESEAMDAILPYSKKHFSVPKNVYILGTMNTADRSIALMDTALRRRFEFIEMIPDTKVLKVLNADIVKEGDKEINVAAMLKIINQRIELLYDREHTIGHAFFTKLRNDPTLDTLGGIFENSIIPLLQEYFYEDYEKIQLVLGDNDKSDDAYKFIIDKKTSDGENLFKGNPDIELPEKTFEVQHDAFYEIESYKQIGEGL